MLEEPELFLRRWRGKRLALDEIHNLENPSQLLKIAADHFPDTQIIATGSSTLSATKKFRDSLTDRHVLIHLTPMLLFEGALFGKPTIEHRLLFGGLPPFFLKDDLEKANFHDWMKNFWAKDIQDLFRVGKGAQFLKFAELLLAQSGSIFEATRFAHECEVSRGTIANYLSVLQTTYFVDVIKPFSKRTAAEIKTAPRVYGFDTGFICYMRDWRHIRQEDYGFLWEHIVLNELKGQLQPVKINYWRDKRGREIDFIVRRNRNLNPVAIECKWSYRSFDPGNIKVFRRYYPSGKNYVVCANIDRPYERSYDDVVVSFVSLDALIQELLVGA